MIRRIGFWPLLIVLAIVALTLRLIGIDWDQGTYLHPDERFVVWVTSDLRWPTSIGQYFNTVGSPLNPYNTDHGSFIYGTFPSFLVKAIAGVFGMDTYGDLYLVGRATNAVFDTGTVLLTALIGRRFFGDRAGLLAALLLAFTPLFLQSAHFFTVDTMAVFFTVAAFAAVVRSWDRHSIGWMALAGVMVGLAGASKPNALIALAFLALPVLELVRTRGWRSLLPRLHEPIYPAVPAALAGGFLAFWSFRLAQPYAFTGPQWWNISLNQRWLDDLAFWRAVQTGLVDMKPSIQWIERTPVLYIMQNMVLWGMGVAAGITAVIALVVASWRLLRSPRWPSWWLLGMVGWCLGSIALYGTGIAQNQRYLMHIYPFLLILAAGLLVELQDRLPRRWIGQLLTTGVIVYTVVYGLAFDSLYVRPITRIEASEWIYENLPTGSVLSNEYWDDALPMPLPDQDRSRFTGLTLDLYADESRDSAKVTALVGQLSQVDYVVLSSNRIIDSVVRQPERYPVAVRFYEMLLSGELGFEPVAEFRQGPEILGIEWDDRSAEESLTVYEHPQVRIFRKTEAYSAQHVHDQLMAAWGTGGYHFIPGDPLPRQMLLDESDRAALESEGSWAEQVSDGWLQQHSLITWYLALQIVGLAAWPLTWRALRNLPDGGWILAKPIGLLAISAITLALVSWRGLAFDRGTIGLALLLLVALGLATRRCDWDEFRYHLPRAWRSILTGELLVLGVFLAFAAIRSGQTVAPDSHLMQLTATVRSTTLPPADLWLAGGVLHTHWATFLPWAALGKALSLSPVVVANLAAVSAVALIAGVVWSLVSSRTRSWMAIVIAISVSFGTSAGFVAGVAPIAASTSVDLAAPTQVLMLAVIVHLVITRPRQPWVYRALLALVVGGLAVSAVWGVLVAVAILAVGLAPQAWARRTIIDEWWPIARRFVLELLGITVAGIALWYPAFADFTATGRDLVSPQLWSMSHLNQHIGIVALVAAIIVAGLGGLHVLLSLTEEGTPGIIVAGIALGTIIVFIILAWRLDSALLLIMLLSLLAVSAAWHWHDDEVLLTAAVFVLLGCGLLVVHQTRAFRPDLAGGSSAGQLVPLAWTLFLLCAGLAAARATVRTRGVAVPVTIATITVALALVLPTGMHVRENGIGNPNALADAGVSATTQEQAASDWLIANVDGRPVILSARGTISAITGFPTVLGDHQSERRMRPGWEGMVEEHNTHVAAIYTGMEDWESVSPLIEQHRVRYIIVGVAERMTYGPAIDSGFADAAARGHLQLVHEADGVTIWQVVSDSD